jgi:hypothetical protein
MRDKISFIFSFQRFGKAVTIFPNTLLLMHQTPEDHALL